MPLSIKRTGLPIDPILTTEEAIQYLRIPEPVSSAERNLVDLCLSAAFDVAENYTRRAIRATTFQLYLNAFPGVQFEIPHPPVRSITKIRYTNLDGTGADLDTSIYNADLNREPAIIRLSDFQSWPSDASTKQGSIYVEYVAGYVKETNPVPAPLLLAILQIASHFYDARSPVVIGAGGLQAVEMPKGFEWALDPYRILDFHDYLEGR
jgi:uncharacterized phiE125 gp8 family phage protein